jgi:hypothetical protein
MNNPRHQQEPDTDPDIAVHFSAQGSRVTARIIGPSGPSADASARRSAHSDYPYEHLTGLLRRRGLDCAVEFGLSDYTVHVALPDGSALLISPPQEPPARHPPGLPPAWLVTRGHPGDPALHEVVYDSEPGGPDEEHGAAPGPLFAAIDSRLEQLGVPLLRGPVAPGSVPAVEAVLHRAGFIPVIDRTGDHHHRLPVGMTDPAEQRRTVTAAVDALKHYGIAYAAPAGLLDIGQPPGRPPDSVVGFNDRLAHLTETVQGAMHSGQVVAALSELTAPGDGALHHIGDVLEAAAEWWRDLDGPFDPLYAAQLHRITGHLISCSLDIRQLRNALADRHTTRPERPARFEGAVKVVDPVGERRQAAAQATSPAATGTRHDQPPPPGTDPAPPVRPGPTSTDPTRNR